jgi:hypothetical protein
MNPDSYGHRWPEEAEYTVWRNFKKRVTAINKTAEGVLEQAAILYRDIEEYTAAVSDDGS